MPLVFSLVMIAGMYIGYQLRGNLPGESKFFKRAKKAPIQEVMDLVNLKYVDSVQLDTLGDDAIRQILSHLDPHSVFIPASDLRVVNEDLQGNFEGIGVEFNIFSDTVHVVSVLTNGPSDQAGIKVGDKFLRVNDSLVAGRKIDSDGVKKLLKGPRGTEVKVIMLRNGRNQLFTINRGTIPLPSMDAAYMAEPGIGYIRLNKFSETTYKEFMTALNRLKNEGMTKLILDLRGNGGGFLDEAVAIADEFLDGNKLIVSTKGKNVSGREERCRKEGLFEKGKLVVLVDESSASASEVLAGALQDWDRATIIGRRSFGKGLVQEQYNLSDGSALRLTIARYYTPTGRSIQKSYSNGIGAYRSELGDRFRNGELVSEDSNRNGNGKGPAFKTLVSGRTVYGGGGIMPDVFVPVDTSRISAATIKLYNENVLRSFVYNYYIRNSAELGTYKDPADFAARFNAAPAWTELQTRAISDSINLSGISAREKTDLQQSIKSQLARFIWRADGYFRVANTDDETFKRALEEAKK